MTAAFNIAALVIMAFVLPGIVNRVKARVAGRRGPRLLQPFFDFAKLLRKGEVVSRTTGLVFRIAPALGLAAVVTAALFVPLASGEPVIGFDGDFVLFAYLLALARFSSVASALDTGSSFEGMGAAREASFAVLVEPAFFILIGTLGLVTGHSSFASLLRGLAGLDAPLAAVALPLAALALLLMIFIEGGRVPVDDPATHLELTMIHEVMVLDNSGPDLAFIQLSSALKTALLSSLIANLFTPFLPGAVIPVVVWCAVLVAVALAVGAVESLFARLRMTHVPQFVFLMLAFALILLFTAVFALQGGLS